jgi:predicted peptidase
MAKRTWLAAAAIVAALSSSGLASARGGRESGFLDRSVTVDGVARAYQVYVPRGMAGRRGLPVILFLHGAGERGGDGLLPTQVGIGSAIRRHADRWPAIVVMPQTPPDGDWHEAGSRIALAALDAATREFGGDKRRTYLTGLSLGGNGSLYLAYHEPDRFAAVVVMCGFVSPVGPYPGIRVAESGDPFAAIAARIARAKLPVWIVHGEADPVVPVSESRRMDEALRAAGAEVQYHELPGVGHDAWDAGYDDPRLIAWLFARHR